MKPKISIALITLGLTFPAPVAAAEGPLVLLRDVVSG